MKELSLIEELLNDGKVDKKILKSFYPKDYLSPIIFDKNKQINDVVRKKLISISDSFINYLGVDFFVHDIVLTGSLASYGWSEYSDLDLHILIDFKETTHNKELLTQFFDAKKDSWSNTHTLKIKNFDVEIYVQDTEEEHISSGVYSILNNKWINKPETTNVNIDEKKIINKSNEYMKNIDDLIEKHKNNENIVEPISKLYKKLKNFRKCGLKEDGEYSYENLTFKYLRRNGYIKKLINLKNAITDKDLSINEQKINFIITEAKASKFKQIN